MSQQRTDRPLSNREEIDRRLKAASQQLDEPYPGYREHMYDVALKTVGLEAKHNYEPISDINKQLIEHLSRAGDTAHAKLTDSEESAR